MRKSKENPKSKSRIPYQTLDEVIARLQTLREERGNLPVKILLPGCAKKPIISGIRYTDSGNTEYKYACIDIVPKYDVMGLINELSGTNSVLRGMNDIKTLFVQFCKDIMSVKSTLEFLSKGHATATFNGKKVEIVPHLKGDFKCLYEMSKKIREAVLKLSGFNDNLAAVIKEPISDGDYPALYSHHIDISLSDSEFARAITDGIGEKTSVQRLAVFVDILRKIDKEIESRDQRIRALEKRIAAEGDTNEGMNAKILKNKSEGIIKTLTKRRKYIRDRFHALKSSVESSIGGMVEEIETICRRNVF